MAVPFSNTKLRVPKGFQNILEGLAREVLRNQPENIFEFGAKYFDQLLRVRDETGHDPAVHGARMEDRFYNNDAFRSPGVDSGDPQQQDAALKIQTEYRRHSAKKEVDGMREEDAATTIQAGVRGHQDRQKVDEMKETEERLKSQDVDINLDDPEVEAAAVKIQAGFKGYKARKEVKETKESQETSTEEKKEIDINLDDPEVEKAATKIQAGFRGHKTRKEMKESAPAPTEGTEEKKEDPEDDVDIDLNDPETAQAALKIQAGFRGYKTRKEVKESLQAEEGKTSEETPQTEKPSEQTEEAKQEETKTEEAKQGETTAEEAKQETVDIDLNDPEVAKAATKIQAGFKGYKVRKDMKKEGEATTEEAQQEKAPTEDAPTEQAPAPTEEAPKEGKEKKIVDLPLEDSQRIMEALSAFKTFKKPEKLPDRLRLSRNHVKKILKWYKTSKEKINEGTLTGMQQAAFETQKTFSGFGNKIGFFDSDEEAESSDDDDMGDFNDADFFKDIFGDDGESSDFEKGIENMFAGLFGGIGNVMVNNMTSDGDVSNAGISDSLGGLITNMTDQASTMAQPMMKLFDKATYYKPVVAAIGALEPWIEQSRNVLDDEQTQKLQKQLDLYIEIKELLDQEQEDDEPHEREARGARVSELANEVDKIGPLPNAVQEAMNKASSPSEVMENLPNMMNNMTSVLTEGMSNMFTGGPKATGESDGCTIL